MLVALPSLVQQKELEQWYLKITEYKERLLEDLKQLRHWPQRVVAMQKELDRQKPGGGNIFSFERE